MTLVVDASVIVKWPLSDPDAEVATERATQLAQQQSGLCRAAFGREPGRGGQIVRGDARLEHV
jgi:hypothetical protein